MPVQLKGKAANSLTNEISNISDWYNSSLPFVLKYKTVREFYEGYIEPRLPDTLTVTKWTELLLKYVDEDAAVFAIRKFEDRVQMSPQTGDLTDNDKTNLEKDITLCKKMYGDNGKEVKKGRYVNPYTLRRGFLTEFNDKAFTYFFTDNNFAKYFTKMAYDGFVPPLPDLKNALKDRTFSARFGPSDKEERDKAAYDIAGVLMPEIQLGHYLGHIINTGMNYFNQNYPQGIGLTQICSLYFPRGAYEDWKDYRQQNWSLNNIPNSSLSTNIIPGINFVRKMNYQGGIEYLKAHFLRFVCPINYFLAPKKEYQGQDENATQGYYQKNVAEVQELQEYIIGRFWLRYRVTYVKYLEAIMWKDNVANVTKELNKIKKNLSKLGNHVLDFGYAPNYDAQKVKKFITTPKKSTQKNTRNAKATPNQNSPAQSNTKNSNGKISYNPSLVNDTAAIREAYLLKHVSPNYLDKSGLKKITDINGIVNSLFPGKNLFDLTKAQDISKVWNEVKKQPWNDKTSNGIPAAIVSSYCKAVTGQSPKKN